MKAECGNGVDPGPLKESTDPCRRKAFLVYDLIVPGVGKVGK